MDERIPAIAAIAVGVCAYTYFRWRREKARLHHERGYDAPDPALDKAAWENTRSKLRDVNQKGRLWLNVIRGGVFAPIAALLAIGFAWAGIPSGSNPALHWDMMGIAAVAALGAWFMGRMALQGWRALRKK